jgi:hypothetical protein
MYKKKYYISGMIIFAIPMDEIAIPDHKANFPETRFFLDHKLVSKNLSIYYFKRQKYRMKSFENYKKYEDRKKGKIDSVKTLRLK